MNYAKPAPSPWIPKSFNLFNPFSREGIIYPTNKQRARILLKVTLFQLDEN
jgi:hypothetical protein